MLSVQRLLVYKHDIHKCLEFVQPERKEKKKKSTQLFSETKKGQIKKSHSAEQLHSQNKDGRADLRPQVTQGPPCKVQSPGCRKPEERRDAHLTPQPGVC